MLHCLVAYFTCCAVLQQQLHHLAAFLAQCYSFTARACFRVMAGRMIYVGGLSFYTKWQGVKDHMKKAGHVEFADVLLNEMGTSKGVAFVQYATEAEAQKAVAQLNGSTLEGNVIVVDPWTGRIPSHQQSRPKRLCYPCASTPRCQSKRRRRGHVETLQQRMKALQMKVQ